MVDLDVAILGAGVTGLAAGLSSGHPVYESSSSPGGICASYYIRPGYEERLPTSPGDGTAYRFETGGGHWIFGGDPVVLRFIESCGATQRHRRMSSVYFSKEGTWVPYPLQNHLRALEPALSRQALTEILAPTAGTPPTMAAWLEQSFGPTLVETFFGPFHERYTAGLWTQVAPQDPYKSPVNIPHVVQGLLSDAPDVGYNTTFLYPSEGLDALAGAIAARCDVRYGKEVVAIDVVRREVQLRDGSGFHFETLVSTLPLNQIIELAGVDLDDRPDPFTSVLVLNIGGLRGTLSPTSHWVYVPDSESGFHRVGFYSNVSHSFVPNSRDDQEHVSLYVERAYLGGTRPSDEEVQALTAATVRELQSWGFIGDTRVVDPTWIDVAYTWSWPHSSWRRNAMKALETHAVFPVGRYGRWTFQGIADSIRDGFVAGGSMR